MRFGHFSFPISHNSKDDGRAIESTLAELELVERLGLDAVWLTEHHFDGSVSYADPVVFAAAVAARTRRVAIGFAVLEMSLHHPVRLAAQTALLDNLSRGRLIVGTGRGSAFNEYEYVGFGIPMDEGKERLAEAEELLVKAWTTENLRFEGRFWNVAFPLLRPRPYQRPHPQLVRACIGEASTTEMARAGRPILLGSATLADIASRLTSYREAMLGAGHDEQAVERALDGTWVQRKVLVADTHSEAREAAEAGFARQRAFIDGARERYNPPSTSAPSPASLHFEQSFTLGTPGQVADEIAEIRDTRARNVMLEMNVGEMEPERVHSSMRLFAEKVMPLFK